MSGGAKNYGYQTGGGKVKCEVRGFTLNMHDSALLNFNTMKANILVELEDPEEECRPLLMTDPYFFRRDVPNKRIKLTLRVKKLFCF